MIKLDDVDKKIIRMIGEDWRQGASKIGKAIGLSHTAVRSRIKRLEREVVKVTPQIDLEKLELKLFVICLDTRHKSKIINHVKNCPKMIKYFDTYGEYNFMVLVCAENTATLESMIEKCFSFRFVDITKFTVLPISNVAYMYQSLKFYDKEEKRKMKEKHSNECKGCEECDFHKGDRCVGCPLHDGYKGVL